VNPGTRMVRYIGPRTGGQLIAFVAGRRLSLQAASSWLTRPPGSGRSWMRLPSRAAQGVAFKAGDFSGAGLAGSRLRSRRSALRQRTGGVHKSVFPRVKLPSASLPRPDCSFPSAVGLVGAKDGYTCREPCSRRVLEARRRSAGWLATLVGAHRKERSSKARRNHRIATIGLSSLSYMKVLAISIQSNALPFLFRHTP